MMRRCAWFVVGIITISLLVGCGGGVQQSKQQRTVPGIQGERGKGAGATQAASKATVEQFDYHGWKALRMSNGLVTLVAVPEIGGRIIEYKLGNHPFLWVNPNELGFRYEDVVDTGTPTFHDFGGYKAWPAPMDKWGGPPDPENGWVDRGSWTYKVLTDRGRKVEIEMTSPPDRIVTGITFTRNVVMYAGTTNVVITEKLENSSDRQVEWAVQHTSQVLGSLAPDTKFSPESKIYFPLNPESKHKRRFVYLDDGGTAQFAPTDNGALMEVSCQGQAGRIGADSVAGWAAHLDGVNNYVFAQRFTPQKLGSYPEENSTVVVRTNAAASYMELGVLSPVFTLAPGAKAESKVEWYGTQMAGPVRDVTEVAAVQQKIQATRSGEQFKITGKLGVFAPGELQIYQKDASNKPVGETLKIPVAANAMIELDKVLPAEKTAATVVVELKNGQGSPLGQVATISVAPTLAKADASKPAPKKDAKQ